MRRVLLDQGLAPHAAALLRQDGWDAAHVSEFGLACASDEEILTAARSGGRVCITLDHDFHANVALTQAGQPSVILLRVERMDAQRQASLIRAVFAACEAAIEKGAAISADGETVRVRRLPLR
jgi:predicted nuclease of predicted toxin-antitoxin system